MTTNQMHDNACHDPATASYPLTHADDWTLFIFFSYWTYELLKVCAFLWFSIHKQAHDRHLLLVDNPGFSFYLLSISSPWRTTQQLRNSTLVSTGTQMSCARLRIWLILFAEGCDTFTILHWCTSLNGMKTDILNSLIFSWTNTRFFFSLSSSYSSILT